MELCSSDPRLSDEGVWLGAHLAKFLFAGGPCGDGFATIDVRRFPTGERRPGLGRPVAFCLSAATEQSAHHAAEQTAGAAHATATAAAATTMITPAATTGGPATRRLVTGIAGPGDAGRDDLGLQRLVLELVEVAGRRIAARGLPALDHRAGLVVELAGRLDVEAEAGETALHVAAQVLVQPDLVFGDLIGRFGEGGRIDASGEVARRRRRDRPGSRRCGRAPAT